jgi:uncharacterized membrane protein YeaQ/YmgE (transglycosylase-associated protein family)
MGWIMTIIIGGLAGYIAERIMKADMGIFGNIGIGIVGAMFANFVLRILGFNASGGLVTQGIVAIGGACALIYIYRAIKARG